MSKALMALALMPVLMMALAVPAMGGEVRLDGNFTQGGLVIGRTLPGAMVKLAGKDVKVGADGSFVIGFGRDADPMMSLEIISPDGSAEMRSLVIAPRDYAIQRIDGLPSRQVTPKPEDVARIKADNFQIGEVRATLSDVEYFLSGFNWPVSGPISGVYGSQRILNDKPRNPHNGVDIAAPKGTIIRAPADGRVALAHADMFYTGKTMMIDHGLGLATVYAHMDEISVNVGERVKKGDAIGAVGNTGRTTGAHLHWGMTWKFTHLDPALVVGPMAKSQPKD